MFCERCAPLTRTLTFDTEVEPRAELMSGSCMWADEIHRGWCIQCVWKTREVFPPPVSDDRRGAGVAKIGGVLPRARAAVPQLAAVPPGAAVTGDRGANAAYGRSEHTPSVHRPKADGSRVSQASG